MTITKEEVFAAIEDFSDDKPFVAGETYIPATKKVLDQQDILHGAMAVADGWLTEGRWTKEFSRRLRDVYRPQVRYAIPTVSGSAANLLAITAIAQKEFGSKAIQPGDEVITTAVGFPTTVSPIIQNGAIPVFIDVEMGTYNATPDSVEEAITEKTKGVILPHTLGNPFKLEHMRALCDEENLFLLEDNCDALGSEIDGITTGSLGDLSTISFYPAHHITMGEGGAVITNSPMMAKVVESLRSWARECWCSPGKDNTCGKRFAHHYDQLPFGYDHKYVYSRLGYNLKITDIQSAIGVSQLTKLQKFAELRRKNWQYLHENLQRWERFIVLPKATQGSNPNWFGFVITLQKKVPFTRLELTTYLEENKIGTRLLFGGNLTKQPAFRDVEYRISGSLYNSDVVMNDTFWVGVHPALTQEMLDYMIEVFDTFFRSKSK